MSSTTDQHPAQTYLETPHLPIPALSSIYLYVSGGCNLACRHCWITPNYQSNGNAAGPHIKLEYVQKAIQEAKPAGLASIKLTGGEPTLHPQFRELVSLISDQGLRMWMETNGTLIDASLAAFLREHRMGFISVSLDGATEETHDWMRAVPGSFQRAVNGIKALVEVGYHPQIICTINRRNIPEMGELMALADQLGCGSLKINVPQSIGRGVQFNRAQDFTVEEIIETARWMEEELAPKHQVQLFFDMPMAFRSIRQLGDHLGRCAIMNIVGVLATGEISLCGIGTSIPDLVFGHIETDNLYDVWHQSAKLTELRELVPTKLDGICQECIHRDTCLGVCVANNYHATGKLNTSYYFCSAADAAGLFPESRKRQPQGH